MNGHDPTPPTLLDRLYVALVCAILIVACGLMASECAGLVVMATR